jgi:PAS domain-containing protein
VTLIARGLTNKEMAHELGISERGVAAHVSRLLARFAVPNRASLIGQLVLEHQPFGASPSATAYTEYDRSPYVVTVTMGPDHVFAYVNKRFEAVSGKRAADVVGLPVRSAFPGLTADASAMADAVYRTGVSSSGGPMVARWKDGAGAWREGTFNIVQQALRDVGGRVIGVLEITSEADADKRA